MRDVRWSSFGFKRCLSYSLCFRYNPLYLKLQLGCSFSKDIAFLSRLTVSIESIPLSRAPLRGCDSLVVQYVMCDDGAHSVLNDACRIARASSW